MNISPPRTARLGAAMLTGRRVPYSMNFILTNRCNFRCQYCNVPEHAHAELTTAQFRDALEDLAGAGMARASFSGGEALLRPDLVELVAHAKSLGLSTSLNSNGWSLDEQLDALAPVLDMLMVSLDGPQAVHDRVRAREGSFERVLTVLDRARGLGITTTSITVVGPWNVSHLDEVLALADTHGFWCYFQPAYEDCFDHADGHEPGVDESLFRRLAERLDRARAEGFPVGASKGYTRRLEQGPVFGRCDQCTAGRYFGTVMPDGTVVPCHLTSRQHRYLNGSEIGFARAFAEMPGPLGGPGCAISPYQESDLILGRHVEPALAALRHMRPAPRHGAGAMAS